MSMNPDVIRETCTVVKNTMHKANRYYLRYRSETAIQAIEPGHCIHMAVPGMEALPLKKEFPVFEVNPEEGTMDVMYPIIGGAEGILARAIPNQPIRIEGPIGECWRLPDGALNWVLLVSEDFGGARLTWLARTLCERGVQVDWVAGGSTYGAVASFGILGGKVGANVTTCSPDGLGSTSQPFMDVAQQLLEQNGYGFVASCCGEEQNAAIAAWAEAAGAPHQELCPKP